MGIFTSGICLSTSVKFHWFHSCASTSGIPTNQLYFLYINIILSWLLLLLWSSFVHKSDLQYKSGHLSSLISCHCSPELFSYSNSSSFHVNLNQLINFYKDAETQMIFNNVEFFNVWKSICRFYLGYLQPFFQMNLSVSADFLLSNCFTFGLCEKVFVSLSFLSRSSLTIEFWFDSFQSVLWRTSPVETQ